MADPYSPLAMGFDSWKDYLTQLKEQAEKDAAKRNERIAAVYERRQMRKRPHVPEVYRATATEFRAPFVHDLIRRAVAIISQNEDGRPNLPRVHVNPVKIGIRAESNATLREKWWTAALSMMNRRYNAYGKICDALVADGMSVWKFVREADTWAGIQRGKNEDADAYTSRFDTHKQRHFPFCWEHVPSVTYYPMSGCALEITKRATLPLARQYGLQMDGRQIVKAVGEVRVSPDNNTSAYPPTVDCIEYWSEDQHAVMVDDVVVKVEAHDYGRIPYFCAYLYPSSSADPADMLQPLAWPMLNLQDVIDSFTTIQMNWAFITGYPTPTLEPIDTDSLLGAEEKPKFEWKVGEMLAPPMGFKLSFLNVPTAGGDLMRLRDWLKAMMDQVTLAPILYGLASGDMSGVASNNMIAIAKSLFGPGLQDVAQQLDEMAAFAFRMIEETPVFQTGVPVWHEGDGKYLELKPSDIDGYYEMEHTLEPVIPAERMAKGAFWGDAQARGAVTMNMYREKGLGLENPDEVGIEVDIEAMRKQQTYQSMLWDQVAQRIQADPKFLNSGTPAVLPVGPGGPGVPQIPGVQQPMTPGGPMAAQPQQPAPVGPMGA